VTRTDRLGPSVPRMTVQFATPGVHRVTVLITGHGSTRQVMLNLVVRPHPPKPTPHATHPAQPLTSGAPAPAPLALRPQPAAQHCPSPPSRGQVPKPGSDPQRGAFALLVARNTAPAGLCSRTTTSATLAGASRPCRCAVGPVSSAGRALRRRRAAVAKESRRAPRSRAISPRRRAA